MSDDISLGISHVPGSASQQSLVPEGYRPLAYRRPEPSFSYLGATIVVNQTVLPGVPPEKLIGLKFRILSTDYPPCHYEVINYAEQYDEHAGLQYKLHCKVILDTSKSFSDPEDRVHNS